jgi:galactokinase
MYTLAENLGTQPPPDVPAFLTTLNGLTNHPVAEARSLFNLGTDLIVARAPGRLDVMGGIADYSGSLVLQMPIREATLVALQKSSDRTLRIVSLGDASDRSVSFEMPLSDFEQSGVPIGYEQARALFKKDPSRHWAAYVAGVFLVLMRERKFNFAQGARLLVSSQVPEGKGVSSSAAIEVATMQAVATAFSIAIEPRELAILCQKVENLIVGAPCGVMDQMASACGQEHRLLALLCQPAELQGLVTIPDEIAVWGLDSGVRHSVSGADYGSVRVGAFMGFRIIAERAGLSIETGARGEPVRVIDPKWHGYLANVTTDEFESTYKDFLPTTISGAEFLDRYQGTTDTVTRVQPDRTYAVRVPTAHPIYEHARVRKFAELLRASGPADTQRLTQLGKLMVQSHLSYSACGLGSDGTDRLVRLVERSGAESGLFGAKITGGGSGGTVAVIGQKDATPAISHVAELYAKQTGHRPHIFSGSSPGACSFDVRHVP